VPLSEIAAEGEAVRKTPDSARPESILLRRLFQRRTTSALNGDFRTAVPHGCDRHAQFPRNSSPAQTLLPHLDRLASMEHPAWPAELLPLGPGVHNTRLDALSDKLALEFGKLRFFAIRR
jgi:hypothetical protein